MGTINRNSFLHSAGSTSYGTAGNRYDKAHTDDFSAACAVLFMRDEGTQVVLSKWTESGGESGWKLYFENGQFFFHLRDTSGNDVRVSAGAIGEYLDHSFHHVAVVWNGSGGLGASQAKILVDGNVPATAAVVDAGPLVATISSIAQFNVGAENNGGTDPLVNALTTWHVLWSTNVPDSTISALFNKFDFANPFLIANASDVEAFWMVDFSPWERVSLDEYVVELAAPLAAANAAGRTADRSRGKTLVSHSFGGTGDFPVASGPGGVFSGRSFRGVTASARMLALVDAAHLKFDSGDPFSVAFWFKYTDSTTTIAWFSKFDGGASVGWTVQSSPVATFSMRFLFGNGSGKTDVKSGSTDVRDGAWHHCVCTKASADDVTAVHMWIDGVDVTTTQADAYGGSHDVTNVIQISGRTGASFTIDDDNGSAGNFVQGCLVYDRELSSAEVAALYNSGTPVHPPDWLDPVLGPVGYWILGDDFADLNVVNNETEDFVDITPTDSGSTSGTPPTIDNFVPPVGSQLGRFQEVGFDVWDDEAIKRGMVLVDMGGWSIVIHDGDTFMPGFTGVRNPITSPGPGFRFVVTADAGWLPGNNASDPLNGPRFRFLVTDDAGQEAT